MEEPQTEVMTLYQARSEVDRQGVRFGQSPHLREGVISAFAPDGTELAYRHSDDVTFYKEVLEGLGRKVSIVPALDSDQYGQRTDGACPMCVSLNTDHSTKFTIGYRVEPFHVSADEWEYPEGTDPNHPFEETETPRGVCLDCEFQWVPERAPDGGFSGYNTLEMVWQMSRAEWRYFQSEGDVDDDI